MSPRFLSRCWILLLALVCGCTSRPAKESDQEEIVMLDPEFTAEQLRQVTDLPRLFGKPSKVMLFEGLPHPMFEEKLLASEISKYGAKRIEGQKFYKSPQVLAPEESTALLALLGARSTHHGPSSGMKLCGGFHADYALQWKTEEGTFTVLVCLGCHEIVMHGPKMRLYTDISEDAYARLRPLLVKYRKLRPETERLR